MPGWASWNRPSRGTSQLVAKVWIEVIDSSPPVSSRAAAKAPASRASASVAAGASRSPVSVSATLRVRRRNSGAPTRSSSSRIW